MTDSLQPKKLLLTGASGFLGWNVLNVQQTDWQIVGITHQSSLAYKNHSFLQQDLTDCKCVKKLVHEVAPQVILHTAAISDSDYCQAHKEEAHAINVEASVTLANLAAERDIPMIFISSDLVFDGNNAPYKEMDTPNPLSAYGEQKVEAEEKVLANNPKACVCRVPLMFGESGPVAKSILQHTLKNLREGKPINLFTDEFRTPANAASVAKGLFLALENQPRILHLGGAERISRFDFGMLIAKVFKIENTKITPTLRADLKLTMPRPADVSLDSGKALGLGYKLSSLLEELTEARNHSVQADS